MVPEPLGHRGGPARGGRSPRHDQRRAGAARRAGLPGRWQRVEDADEPPCVRPGVERGVEGDEQPGLGARIGARRAAGPVRLFAGTGLFAWTGLVPWTGPHRGDDGPRQRADPEDGPVARRVSPAGRLPEPAGQRARRLREPARQRARQLPGARGQRARLRRRGRERARAHDGGGRRRRAAQEEQAPAPDRRRLWAAAPAHPVRGRRHLRRHLLRRLRRVRRGGQRGGRRRARGRAGAAG